jgi:hypothetical protein
MVSFLQVFLLKGWVQFSPMHATYHAHLMFHDLINVLMFGEEYRPWKFDDNIFSVIISMKSSSFWMLFSHRNIFTGTVCSTRELCFKTMCAMNNQLFITVAVHMESF